MDHLGSRGTIRAALLASVSSAAFSGVALAQEGAPSEQSYDETDTIVVTGVRASVDRAIDTKRNADGVVDAISAEDIGKFPDTNLAESLQRVTGVSIDRVNGEGSQVTVRGFGPDFNLVTLNGRTMPTAEVNVIGARGNYDAGGSRSFDFSNFASEGVRALEVYKTGQATLPTGGIGATINILTRRPLDQDPLTASLQAKALHDSSVDRGDDVTPELSGFLSWKDESERFGASVFASYSRRDSAAGSQQVNDWINLRSEGGEILDAYLRSDGSTQVTNPPSAGQLYAVAQDSRYDFSEIERERINGQLTVQFAPIETLVFTGDYTFTENQTDELRYQQTNWFARPFDQLIFEESEGVATAVFQQENNNGSKDIGFEQTNRAIKDELSSWGFNADWEASDQFTFIVDAHKSTAESGGNNPLGHLATMVGIAAPVILRHEVDFRSGFPVQDYEIDDSVRGNGNGVLDAGDLGTQVFRSSGTDYINDVGEVDLRGIWDSEYGQITVGANLRDVTAEAYVNNTLQELGSWGIANPGDVEQFAPGVIEEYCLACRFDDIPVGRAETAFRADAVDLWQPLLDAYPGITNNQELNYNRVDEEILAVFASYELSTDLMGRPFALNAGLRYEETDVTSATVQQVPSGIRWTSDNDFILDRLGGTQSVTEENSYDHFLPNVDVKMDVAEDVVLRASYSKTIGRPVYSNLYAQVSAGVPSSPTALGGQAAASSQNPQLVPLESDNFDVSVEWYYAPSSYASVGYFRKETENFVGGGVVNRPLFDLRDPASGAPGTRSGDALDILEALGVDLSDANLFSLTALIDANGGNVAAAQAEFEGLLDGNSLPQSEVDRLLILYDVTSNADDPILDFAVNQPINANDGTIDGWEFAWTHFFGDSGFGFQANYTIVDGDIVLDPNGSTEANQFALTGLSDTANLTGIYENYGFSARLAYNWRDAFLFATNQTPDRSGFYTDEFEQLDLNVSYDINDQLAVSFEAINITGEDLRQYHRVPNQFLYSYEQQVRYQFGVRYNF